MKFYFMNNIFLFFIYSSIYPLIMDLELLPKSPLGYQVPRWVTYVVTQRYWEDSKILTFASQIVVLVGTGGLSHAEVVHCIFPCF